MASRPYWKAVGGSTIQIRDPDWQGDDRTSKNRKKKLGRHLLHEVNTRAFADMKSEHLHDSTAKAVGGRPKVEKKTRPLAEGRDK